jgi:hypothetical protein
MAYPFMMDFINIAIDYTKEKLEPLLLKPGHAMA